MEKIIYLDNNSTTPLDPVVLESMLPYLKDKFGNPSSTSHKFGRETLVAVEFAREQVASLINADSSEIIFTSGTTESINLALKGIVESAFRDKIHIITTKVEHKAVLKVCEYLEKFGVEITYLPTDKYGMISTSDIVDMIKEETVLICVMVANNEIGTIQPIGEIGKLCKERGILFFTDAAQAVGKIPIDVKALNIDLMAFSAHKIYGPKGIGALYVKNNSNKINLYPQIHGGGQEKGLRSGTLNVPGIVGFGKSCEVCKEKLFDEFNTHSVWRDRIINNLLTKIDNAFLNGHPTKRIPNNINIGFKGISNSLFINEFTDFAISTGSACASETLEPSYVLSSIGRTKSEISCSIRIGIGRFNTEEEIEYIIKRIPEGINKIKCQLL
ncbi:MAG: cysteine desulfurase [Ignavibacteria bacterium]|nr:cysteine desulfurase [Ignavibacteria bacterium]